MTGRRPLPLLLSHRTAAGEAPENTLAGVRVSLEAGVDAIEIDVQLCRDGIPVLMHDATVDRTTDMRGPIWELPVAALQAADAGDGEHVPTLDEVLDLVAGRATMMVELKASSAAPGEDEALVSAAVAAIARHDAFAWTACHSFAPQLVRGARRIEPRIAGALIPLAVPVEDEERLLEQALVCNAQALSLEHTGARPDLVRRAHQQHTLVWAWTADEPQDWARLIEAGVDGMMTNRPSALRAFLDR